MPNDPNAVGAPDSCTATPAFTKFSAFRDWLTGDKSVNDTKFCSPADLLVPAPVAPSLLTSSSATTLGASVADVGRRPIAAAPKIG